jgi:hypothetical protein
MPANDILYNKLWAQEDERRARIVNPKEKKIMDAAGIEPWRSIWTWYANMSSVKPMLVHPFRANQESIAITDVLLTLVV